MTHCAADTLHAHADAIDHTAAVAGYINDRTGTKHPLTEAERAAWAADAAALREAAHHLERGDCHE